MNTRLSWCAAFYMLLPAAFAADTWTIDVGDEPPRYEGIVLVQDADAVGKTAYRTTKGVAGIVQFAYSYETMGVYEAKFRLKVADNTNPKPVISIRYYCETSQFASVPKDVVSSRELKGTDFAQPGVYQEFTLRWLAPQKGRNGWAISATGEAEVWVDAIAVGKVRDVTEAELLTYLPGAAEIPGPAERVGPWRAHLMRGAFSDYFLLDLALPRVAGLRVTSSSFNADGSCAGMPQSPDALYANDVLIMAGTDIAPLEIPMRVALKKWVEAGGALFMLGGPYSFGQAGIMSSVVADVLPVRLQGPFDLKRQKAALAPAPGATGNPILQGVDFSKPMVTLFRHQVAPKEGATVILGTDQEPLLVTGNCGKGRVACFLAAPMGPDEDIGKAETAFWNDPRLPVIFAGVVRSLITRPAPADPPRWQPPAAASPRAKRVVEQIETSVLDLSAGGEEPPKAGGGQGMLEGEAGTDEPPPKLTPADLDTLVREGGALGAPVLLRALPGMTDREQIRRIEWAVRPFVGKQDFKRLAALSQSPHEMIREAAVSLLGKSDPERAPAALTRFLNSQEPRVVRAVCRSALDGELKDMTPFLKKTHARLKAQVEHLRLAPDGYWHEGLPAEDPAWAYAECTMALLRLGEPGSVRDAADLLFLLHIEDMKMRTFIFNYDPKVPREAKMAESHQRRNAFVHPDLTDLLERVELAFATLPAPLHAEFREALLQADDFEKTLRLLYPAYDMAAGGGDEAWKKFLTQLEDRAFKLAVSAERF